jgi:hypothetical protein
MLFRDEGMVAATGRRIWRAEALTQEKRHTLGALGLLGRVSINP